MKAVLLLLFITLVITLTIYTGPMRVKGGVDLSCLKPVMSVALDAAQDAYRKYGKDVVITSGCDGIHKPGSKHYEGYAVDLRIRHLEGKDRLIANLIKDALNEQWDVVLERDAENGPHLHIEFDPK